MIIENDDMRTTTLILITAAALLAGCGGKRGGQAPEDQPSETSHESRYSAPSRSEGDTIGATAKTNEVPSQTIEGTTMRTMGKVVAERYADLSFETALPIERVLVRNGQHVRRGQVLAQLDAFQLRNAIEQQKQAIEQAQLQIEQAHLQMQDVIIAQGYDPDKTAMVPQQVMHSADVKAGYALAKSKLATARTQLAAAQHQLRSGVLTAPFDGVVANVAVQAHQLAQAGQPVCRVIASGDMAVEFRVMETDLSRYNLGTTVRVIPAADHSRQYSATVSEMNPVVDEQGAVTLRARLTAASELFDGMNVTIEN